MRKIPFAYWCILPFILFYLQASSQVTTFSYQNIPSYIPPFTCFFNTPPGPTNPVSIGGYNHYGIVGGVDYTGSEFVLNADNTGGGSGFGIYFGFSQNYQYTIKATAKASASTMKLLWAINPYRQAVPASCSPGFPNIITQAADATSSITNLTASYVESTLVQNYVPSAATVNYLLLSDYNTVGTIGNVQIQTITITAACRPPVLNSVTALGGGQAQIAFTHPAGNTGVNNFNVIATRYDIVYTPFPIFIPVEIKVISNVGLVSPVTVNLITPGSYIISLQSACSSGQTSLSNSVSATIN